MKPITRQIAIGGLIAIGLTALIVSTFDGIDFSDIVSTVVVGIVGILKPKESDE